MIINSVDSVRTLVFDITPIKYNTNENIYRLDALAVNMSSKV